MKFLHTGDLHIGKRIFEKSLMEDQRFILRQIFDIAVREKIDALLIAGDVYDRQIPSTESVSLLDDFLTSLIERGIPVIVISGNHDSSERVSFANRILEKRGLFIAGTYNGKLKTVEFEDEIGSVSVICMPFVKPAVVGEASAAEAVGKMLSQIPQSHRENHRRVLLTHFFVTGEKGELPELSDSETDVNVGGLDSIPVGLLQNFDYVALGHIHRPQRVGGGNVYYAGAPLKYSFGETFNEKSVNLVYLGDPGEVKVERILLRPLREMRCIRGRLQDLMDLQVQKLTEDAVEDYVQATLIDKEELIDPVGTLRSVYPNVLQVILERNFGEGNLGYVSRIDRVKKSTEELFGEFYEMLRGEPMDEKRCLAVREAADQARNEMSRK